VALVAAPYPLKSVVPAHIFDDFISELEGQTIQVTTDNYAGLTLLCQEFGFDDLANRLKDIHESQALTSEHSDLSDRLSALEELTLEQGRHLAALQTTATELNDAFRRISELEKTVNAIQKPATNLVVAPAPRQLDSQIIGKLPALFVEFQRKQFQLLWRGTRDGFKVADFHNRCDGHGNTLVVIKDTKGNVFGGFTPAAWESRVKLGGGANRYKGDDTISSWLFTLTNPHKIAPRKFHLKREYKNRAIFCGCSSGPEFGIGWDGWIWGCRRAGPV
jgi:hypothetical protein